MVNSKLSTKASLLIALREKPGMVISGSKLARSMGISRVAVWKGIQALIAEGYPIQAQDAGYALDPGENTDFLYPWEFGEREAIFRHFSSTGSTMDQAREFALQGLEGGTVVTAEKQSMGRGRNGSTWASRQGGLFCTFLDRPSLSLADYCQNGMLYQIAAARALFSLCGKQALLRWPNDVYIGKRKIAGLITELAGEGDTISWLTTGIGINVNNQAPSGKAISCTEISGRHVSRRELLLKIISEAEQLKKSTSAGMAYTQGNRLLAAEWNNLAEGIGAKAAVVDYGSAPGELRGRILARGIFAGIDPAGRCIIKSENGKRILYFNPGMVSIVFLQ